eukprot:6745495-Prymnesium_polylepis.2
MRQAVTSVIAWLRTFATFSSVSAVGAAASSVVISLALASTLSGQQSPWRAALCCENPTCLSSPSA